MTTDDPDSPLAVRARDGDRAAFEELVRRTSRLVFARLFLETGDRHRAEDLTQETFLLAYKSVHRLREPKGFRPWLLAIAHSVGLRGFEQDGALRLAFARAAVAALARPVVRIDVSALSVTY